MDLKKLETIMKLMRKHNVQELSIESPETGEKLSLTAAYGAVPQVAPAPMPYFQAGAPVAQVAAPEGSKSPREMEAGGSGGPKLKGSQRFIKSPFVGTYYGSPSPGSDPFVKVGHKVKKGDVLCIVEAMKLMNEIEAESDGIIVDVLVQNEQPVEYDQPLFIVE